MKPGRHPCLLCHAPVADGEPFLTALVSMRGQLEHKPFHLSCHELGVAQLVVDALAPLIKRQLERRVDDDQVAAVVSEIIARMG